MPDANRATTSKREGSSTREDVTRDENGRVPLFVCGKTKPRQFEMDAELNQVPDLEGVWSLVKYWSMELCAPRYKSYQGTRSLGRHAPPPRIHPVKAGGLRRGLEIPRGFQNTSPGRGLRR